MSDDLTRRFDQTVAAFIRAGLTDEEIIKRVRSDPDLVGIDGPNLDLWIGRLRNIRKALASEEYMHKLTAQSDQAWSQSELDWECRLKYGFGWVWDSNLRMCVNSRIKPSMALEKEEIIKLKVGRGR